MRVAAIQMALRFWPTEADFAGSVMDWSRRASDAGAVLAVFPEDVGLPLVCLDDYDLASRATTVTGLAMSLIQRHWKETAGAAFRPGFHPARVLFQGKAARMEEVYNAAFSAAARECGLHIVAGSLPLPCGRDDAKPLHNLSRVFGPDGKRVVNSCKVELLDMEARDLGLQPAGVEELGVFDCGESRVGVAICKDVWNPSTISHLSGKGAQVIASPQANPAAWDENEQASNREGLYARCRELGVAGIQAMGVGNLAGLEFQGQSAIFARPVHAGEEPRILAQASDATGEHLVIADLNP